MMNNIRYRIAFLAGSSVIITILTVMLIFNITIRHKTEHDAYNALNSQRSASENTDVSIYTPETIIIPEDNDENSLLTAFYTSKERAVLRWYDTNGNNDISKADIDGNTYYILKIDADELDSDMVFTGGYVISDDGSADNDTEVGLSYIGEISSIISYVDVTGEMKMIGQIDLFFVLTALLIGTLSSVSGYCIGLKLEQNQLAQKQFFENTSHELKTPLTAIQGYAEGIEKGVITDLPRTGQVISAQTSKMSRMIEEILCIARIESGALKLEKEPLSLDGLIQDCLMPFEGTVRNKGIDVSLDLSDTTVTADADKLEHAVSNLLINAIKYARTKINISCDSKSVCISNDCAPMSDDTLKHIFDRFYTGQDGNTGIGLSLAKEIIELHGWSVYAKRVTDGIIFTIEIK